MLAYLMFPEQIESIRKIGESKVFRQLLHDLSTMKEIDSCLADRRGLEILGEGSFDLLEQTSLKEALEHLMHLGERKRETSIMLINGCCLGMSGVILKKALDVFFATSADALIGVDASGEEQDCLMIFKIDYLKRSDLDHEKDRKKTIPFELAESGIRDVSEISENVNAHVFVDYSEEQHRETAEKYRDRIKDRVLFPENVPAEQKKLIQDDLARIRAVLGMNYGKKVLEVGCSDGTVSIEIAKNGPEVIGVDIAESAIQEANEQKAKLEPAIAGRLEFVSSPVEKLDLPDEYFDTICAFEVLEHVGIGQLGTTIKNLLRMLKQEGDLLVSVPNRYPKDSYIEEGRSRWKWPNHFHFFSRLSLEYFLRKYFELVTFFPWRENEQPEDGIYLICECKGKRL